MTTRVDAARARSRSLVPRATVAVTSALWWGSAVGFFVYDTTKALLLLGGIIFAVTVFRLISVERTRALLGGRRGGAGHLTAAALGVATPCRKCSAVRVPSLAEVVDLIRKVNP